MASSIYIHLPFCKTKCPYCDFASFADYKSEVYKNYLQALSREIEYRCQNFIERPKLETIYFGGGTPSIHNPEEIDDLFRILSRFFDFSSSSTEITLEANPGTVDFDKLKGFNEVGINRLSLGVQSFSQDLLSKLARGHTAQEAKEIIELVRKLDFRSWSIDLIYGLPHQSFELWQSTIEEALAFSPPHISSYALSIEPTTPFGDIYGDSSHRDLPVEDEVVRMYNYLNERLEKQNINRYEISNWALKGHEAKHNLCYWQAKEYYAFGLSAHGYINGKRYANNRNITLYIKQFLEEELYLDEDVFLLDESEIIELVSEEKKLEEMIFLNLRLKKGLELNEKIEEKINKQNMQKFIEQGLLEKINNRLILSQNALMISNRVIFELIK